MPYIPPQPETSPNLNRESTKTTSSFTTPSFTNSSFEPASKATMYSSQAEMEARHPDSISESAPDTSDIIPSSDLPRASSSTVPVSTSKAIKRTTWSDRKPVPSNILLPDPNLPSTHPFARGATSPRITSPELTIPPASPTPIGPRSGPVPPRRAMSSRSTSNINIPLSPAGSDMTEKSGLFWQTPGQADSKDNVGQDESGGVETLLPPSQSIESNDRSESSSGVSKPIISPKSPKRSLPVMELGRPIISTASSSEAASSSSHHGNLRGTPPARPPSLPDHHPLRLRFDKSLPALPLELNDTPVRPARQALGHQHMESTSTAPSTHLITPPLRSASQTSAQQLPAQYEEGASGQGKPRLKWAKSFKDLTKGKKNKEKSEDARGQEGPADQPETSGATSPTRADTSGESEEDDTFSVDRIPSKRKLWEAGTLFLRDEDGDLVCFGDMFPKVPSAVEPGQPVPPIPRTVVFFIRHFWCGQCQDFMFASLSQLDPEAVENAGIKVIVISNGSWKIIKSYKKLFKCPFPIYVDGPRKLYQLLGMTKMTNDFGPLFKGRAAYHQRSVPGQLLHGSKNALTKMPLAYPGKLTQLGGEFILSPGYNCDFAHRMTTTSNHMEAPDVLRQAGCLYPTKFETHEIIIEENQRAEFERLELEMQDWRQQREAELERIRRRKAERRGLAYIPIPMANSSVVDLGLDQTEAGDSTQAKVQPAVPIPAEAPDESVSDAQGIEPSVGRAPDVLAWPVEEDNEDDADREKLDRLFHEAMKIEQVYQKEGQERHAVRTHGPQNGLEVQVDK